jgi:hypothetical protein
MRNDIALLKLRSPIKYTDAIRPIALPSASDGPKLSRLVTKALAAGWGDLSEGRIKSDFANHDLINSYFSESFTLYFYRWLQRANTTRVGD